MGTAPASRSCTQGCHGHGHAVPGMGFCRWESSWAGSSARIEALATSMSRYGTALLCLCPCPSPSPSQAYGAEHKGQKPRTLPGCASTAQCLPKSSACPPPEGTSHIPLQPTPPLGSLWPWEHERAPSLLSLPQGCFSTFGRTLQRYISLPGTCSLAVLGIEVMRGARDRAGRVSTLYGRGIAQWAGRGQRGSDLS